MPVFISSPIHPILELMPLEISAASMSQRRILEWRMTRVPDKAIHGSSQVVPEQRGGVFGNDLSRARNGAVGRLVCARIRSLLAICSGYNIYGKFDASWEGVPVCRF